MPWFLITWQDHAAKAIKRQLIHRDDESKVWAYLEGRIKVRRYPEDAYGFYFQTLPDDHKLIWDWELDTRLKPQLHAMTVPEWVVTKDAVN